jgi:hypothetical protein
VVEILEYFWLSWEALFPIPIIVKLFREIHNVDPTLAVRACSGITVSAGQLERDWSAFEKNEI